MRQKKITTKPSDAPERSLRKSLGLAPTAAIAGLDEAGRGAWAGPVYAAAAVLPPDTDKDLLAALDDSKQLSPVQRSHLAKALHKHACVSVASADLEEISTHNILGATLLAMCRAVASLPLPPDAALIDGTNKPRDLPCPARTLVRGDALSFSVAAAGILAKVARDTEMERLDKLHPNYGFARHRGYGTAAHRESLKRLGVCPIHRKTFRPIAHLVAGESGSTK